MDVPGQVLEASDYRILPGARRRERAVAEDLDVSGDDLPAGERSRAWQVARPGDGDVPVTAGLRDGQTAASSRLADDWIRGGFARRRGRECGKAKDKGSQLHVKPPGSAARLLRQRRKCNSFAVSVYGLNPRSAVFRCDIELEARETCRRIQTLSSTKSSPG